ncbi:hypothetical protein NW759_004002 [Fusarium solani]|nr:hypothetical protein NW759_004002 [Fusarium solani]
MRRMLCCGISRSGDHGNDQPGRPVEAKPAASQQQSNVPKQVDPVVLESKEKPSPSSFETSPTTGPPEKSQVKSNLWDEAMGRLSEDDKTWINGNSQQFLDSSGPGIRSIIALVDEKRQECEAKRWTTVNVFSTTINLSDLASNAITWLNKFKEVGDTIVQYDPGHAALPWAAMRFILQSAISYEEHMAFSLISVEKTTRIVHRCQIYELLYNCDTINVRVASGLEKALVDLYASLLHILARVGKFLCRGTASRSLYAVFRPTEGTDLLSELEKFENEVIKEASVCESTRSAESDAKSREQVQKLQSLLKLEEPVLRIDENVQKVLEKMEVEELIRVLNWISPLEYNQPHERIKEARTKGTCNWIVEQSKFYEWQSETSSITFWLQGFAGTGKTFITSRVIDLVAETLGSKPNHEGFAYFYCNQTEPTRRQALSVLRSFIRQLSSPRSMSGHLDPKLKQLYVESRLNGAGWTLNLCKEYLVHLFNLYPHTTIILDALDECEIEERRLLLDIFDYALKSSSRPVKIFISSRPEGDIRQRLIHLPNLEISARNNAHDIAKFINQSTASESLWSIALAGNPVLKEEIVQTLIKKSDGKFQWARLQVDQLRVIDHVKDLRARLGKLPKDLKSSYDEIYQRIQDRPEYSRVRTLRALKWVMASPFPLSTEDLLGAIRVDPDTEEIDGPGEVTEEQLLGWCANLLFLDKTPDPLVYVPAVWRPCHLSVVEYLDERFTTSSAHLFVTMANLFILLVKPDKAAPQERFDQPFPPLQDYALRLWTVYVQKYDDSSIDFSLAPYDNLTAMLKRFLGSPTNSSDAYDRWVRLVDSVGLQRGVLANKEFLGQSSPLFGVCVYPVFYPLRDWWESADVEFDPFALNQAGESLLTMAVMSGYMPICESLIRRGTPVNPEKHGNCFGSPLTAAAARGHTHIVEFLLKRGAHVDLLLQGGRFGSALAAARSASICRLLVDRGADVNLLLHVGAYGSALASAASYGSPDKATLLINNGADVNLPLPHGHFGNALIAAVHSRSLDMARLLVEHGADVNQLPPTGIYGSALIAACFKFDPSPAIVEFLIENGAEVNAIPKVGRWGSALAAAVRTDILNTSRILEIDMLIKYGADVNLPLPTGLYGSALISAASTDFASCRYLVEKGADVHLHIPHGCYGSPLIAAMQSHSMKLVRFLLDRGVEVDQIPDGEEVVFGTALIAGAYWGFASGVQILLDAGAQVNLRTEVGRFGSALAAARADLTDEGGVFEHTPWYEEEERDEWKPEVEELLLKYGATE